MKRLIYKSDQNKQQTHSGHTGDLFYYIETDGKVYLIEQKGPLQFPTDKANLPFAVEEKQMMRFNSFTVMYCTPVLEKHPEDWYNRDDIPALENVHHAVRESLHMSFPRCVAEVLAFKNGKVLLVNASRGVTKGMWNLPGGFMEYGESPSDCILREIKEELGVDSRIISLRGVYNRASAHHPFHLIAFVYECELDSTEFKLDPDEIAEADWFEIEDALRITKSQLTKEVITKYISNSSK